MADGRDHPQGWFWQPRNFVAFSTKSQMFQLSREDKYGRVFFGPAYARNFANSARTIALFDINEKNKGEDSTQFMEVEDEYVLIAFRLHIILQKKL